MQTGLAFEPLLTYYSIFSLQSLIEEQQTQLNQYECAAGQCVSELQKAQLQVQSLQAKMHESDTNNTVQLPEAPLTPHRPTEPQAR